MLVYLLVGKWSTYDINLVISLQKQVAKTDWESETQHCMLELVLWYLVYLF